MSYSPIDDFPRECWVKVYILERDGIPRSVRMRRFLKSALRAYGIRCEGFAAPTGEVKPIDQGDDGDGVLPAQRASGTPSGTDILLNILSL
jgi:hypothetical protein